MKEGGKLGQWLNINNGTYDVGSMQFNTMYLKDLSKYGITANHVQELVVMPTIWPPGGAATYQE